MPIDDLIVAIAQARQDLEALDATIDLIPVWEEVPPALSRERLQRYQALQGLLGMVADKLPNHKAAA